MPSGYPKDFWDYVEVVGECWLWTGATLNGYGHSSICWGDQYAHRSAWIQEFGDIPENKMVLHKCDVKLCVNPVHLYLGGALENYRDAVERGRLVPARGFQKPNTRLSDNDVVSVFELRKNGLTQKEIGKFFGVCQPHISDILRQRKRTSVVIGG